MIHWTPEGQTFRPGLNLFFTRSTRAGIWLRVVWRSAWQIHYFRWRQKLLPHAMFERTPCGPYQPPV